MFNYLHRILFALSSASPMVIIAAAALLANGGIRPSQAIAAIAIAVSFFIVGGLWFLSLANRSGEVLRVQGSIREVRPSGQWLPVLFGSYCVPLLGLLHSPDDFYLVIIITAALTIVALMASNIPPAAFLLLFRYHFYEVSFSNGASGYNLISKRKAIRDPKSVSNVIKLFDNEYWLLEKEL